MSFTLIETPEDLEVLNAELLEQDYLGLDTEFRRTTKENMKLALLQINDGEEIYLVDTIQIKYPKDSCEFLFSDSVVKIFHSCKEDLEAIYSWTGNVMKNLFDTQLANAFLGGNYSIGYQGLVQESLGIKIDKKETRSNWVRRPLSDSQLNYAASDVEYLIYLFREQHKDLMKSNKLDWHNEEINFLISSTFDALSCDEKIVSTTTKSEEIKLLNKFNEIIINISIKEDINPTLFLSKKNQKDFIRIALSRGLEEAFRTITGWRKILIEDSLKQLLDNY